MGDRGTILHTDDGGQTWHVQPTPVDARLAAASFVSPQVGWAVGGRTRPHTLLSKGIVLATTDGGQTWRELPTKNLPALADVKFFDRANGVAVGRASSMQASGVFVTQDGGLSWQSIPGGGGWSWQTGDFIDPTTGSVAGRGLWAGVDRRTMQSTDGEPPRIRAIRDLVLVPPTGGWAAGDGGLILTTPNLGRAWFAPPAPLPNFASRHFDLQVVAVYGEKVWVAGAPGSRVFHSPDGGRTWQTFATGVPTPLVAMRFIDELCGVAVGELGVILTTGDGGRTWQVRRRGGSRTPLLVVAARDDSVSLEVLAESSADNGYLASVSVLLRDPTDELATTVYPQSLVSAAGDDAEGRLHEATTLAGGSSSVLAWRFPLARSHGRESNGEVLAELDRQTDGRTLALLEAHLVRQIRMWRPEVIVVGASPSGATPEDALTRQIVLTSVTAAADSTRHIDLMTDADLAAWQVQRVFAVQPQAADAEVTIVASTIVSRHAVTIGQIAERARSILAPSAKDAATTLALAQLWPADAPVRHLRTIFDGMDISPGSDGRRAPAMRADAEVRQAAAVAEKQRNVHAILAGQVGNAALASHLATLTDGLDDASRARVLFDLADGHRTAGQNHLAAELLERLVREHPESELADGALVWLIQYHAGSETRTLPSPPPPGWGRGAGGGGEKPLPRAVSASNPTANSDDHPAVAIAHLAAELRPNLLFEPQVGVPLAAAYRRAGLPKQADRYMLLLRQRGAHDAWRELADAERWLAEPTEEPPSLPIWTCRQTNERPHLDGVLDEPFWRGVRPAVMEAEEQDGTLKSPTIFTVEDADNDRTEIRLAYDQEFLFLAAQVHAFSIDAQHAFSPSPSMGASNPFSPSPSIAPNPFTPSPSMGEGRGGGEKSTNRPIQNPSPARRRDEDLAGCDRIALAIDLDRDLTTYYELVIDDRGRAHEAAWHDARWNPKWYIAHAKGETGWTIEAAIPLAELAATPPLPRDVWCIGARRIDSDGRATPWHGPATAEMSPASFGLLIFD